MFVPCKSPLREGSYRALASTANNFARESMIDDLARAADSDPLAFRQQHLRDKRLRQVLEAAATAFNWRQRSRSSAAHHGVGLSCGTEKDSYVAACVEVVVESGRVHILEICQAFDCGAIQNPANLKAQVEACLLMGLGPAMFEQIEYAKGRISNASFADYRVPRFGDVPHLRTVLINRREQPSVGGGETPIIAVAPALANAICDATGKRLSRLPLKTTML